MNSSFPNRWSFSYLKFTKYVTNIIAEPKYKHGQQEQVTVKFMRFPCAHINSFTYAKNQKLLYTLLRIFTAVTGWLYFLILLAGDIELNPGPYSPDTSLSSDSSGSHMDVSVFESNFSVVHYNVQSLLNKIDLLQVELSHFELPVTFSQRQTNKQLRWGDCICP